MQLFCEILASLRKFVEDDIQILPDILFVVDLIFEAVDHDFSLLRKQIQMTVVIILEFLDYLTEL